MNVITESELREWWQNGRGQIPAFPLGTRFSASAQDFLRAQGLEARPAAGLSPSPAPAPSPSAWDEPARFPVVLNGALPICSECGLPLAHKPEHMTQIDAGHFAPKTAARVGFRGRVDSLHGLVMLSAAVARRFELPELAGHLDTLAAYCREIMSAEYNLRPVAALTMMGKGEEELHRISHWPERYLGIPHLAPSPQDHEMLHWLNVLRTQTREVELAALQAFPPGGLDPDEFGIGLNRAINRLSSAIYVLELYFQSGRLSWKVTL